MTTAGEIAAMAHQHSSKPVTKAQKVMSKIHKAHRKEIEKMPKGSARAAKADHYDQHHGLEHFKNLSSKSKAKVAKKLMKMGIKVSKKNG